MHDARLNRRTTSSSSSWPLGQGDGARGAREASVGPRAQENAPLPAVEALVEASPAARSEAEKAVGNAEARGAEDQAVRALVSTEALDDALKTPRALQDLRAWIGAIQQKQARGEKSGVMEHVALVHLVRSGFFAKFGCDRELSRTMEGCVRRAWRDLTGHEARSYAEVLSTPLPRRALRQASRDEQLFHRAVFALPQGGAAGAAGPTRTAVLAKQAAPTPTSPRWRRCAT